MVIEATANESHGRESSVGAELSRVNGFCEQPLCDSLRGPQNTGTSK